MPHHTAGDPFPLLAVLLATLGGLFAAGYVIGYVATVRSMVPAIGWRCALGLALFWPLVWLLPDTPPAGHTGSETTWTR